jgi:hypothetical protein
LMRSMYVLENLCTLVREAIRAMIFSFLFEPQTVQNSDHLAWDVTQDHLRLIQPIFEQCR